MKVIFTSPFLTIDLVITLGVKVVLTTVFQTIAKLPVNCYRRLKFDKEQKIKRSIENHFLFRTFMLKKRVFI